MIYKTEAKYGQLASTILKQLDRKITAMFREHDVRIFWSAPE
jgi:hypothetical protein